MKKLIAGAAAALMAGLLSAQVMQKPGVENTLFTGFGSPLQGDPVFYGFIDALQARVDVGQFTLEGMLNWGAIANCEKDGDLDYFEFRNTPKNPLSFHYGTYSNNKVTAAESAVALSKTGVVANDTYVHGQTVTDDYYVNFLWHPFENFDVGMGTKLNWQVGPAPRFGSWLWEADAHVRQGGFSTKYDDRHGSVEKYQFTPDAPGTADVVGFVPYANKYAKKAIGARWFMSNNDFTMQVGAAIPDGTNTDDFRSNVGAQFQFENFNLAVAYEGLFQQNGNFYAGAGFGVKEFYFDVYFAWDHIDTDSDTKLMSNSAGAAMTFTFEKPGITIVPETAFNWFENTDYLPAWYAGGTVSFNFSENWGLSVWSSFAIGSKDKRWDDYNETKDWGTGNIFTLRPEIKYAFNKNHTFSAYFNWENRNAFDGENRTCWSSGAFWTYKLETGKATAAKKRK